MVSGCQCNNKVCNWGFFNISEEFQSPSTRIRLFTILLYFVCLLVCALALPLACATEET